MRKDYQRGVLAPSQKSASELAAGGQWFDLAGYEVLNARDTGLLRTIRLHQIERHPVQISPEEAAELLAASDKAAGGR